MKSSFILLSLLLTLGVFAVADDGRESPNAARITSPWDNVGKMIPNDADARSACGAMNLSQTFLGVNGYEEPISFVRAVKIKKATTEGMKKYYADNCKNIGNGSSAFAFLENGLKSCKSYCISAGDQVSPGETKQVSSYCNSQCSSQQNTANTYFLAYIDGKNSCRGSTTGSGVEQQINNRITH